MFDYIGEKIRTEAFSRLTWISRAGGFTEMVEVNDGGTLKRFPGAKPQYQMPCEPGDYLNMSPDGSEICIAFTDSAGKIQVDERHRIFDKVSAFFRVVVWYDENRIAYGGATDKAHQMAKEIIAAVRGVNMNNTGLQGCRVSFDSVDFDPAKVWAGYGFKADDALFMRPYRTFAVSFRLRALLATGCADASIQVQGVC